MIKHNLTLPLKNKNLIIVTNNNNNNGHNTFFE